MTTESNTLTCERCQHIWQRRDMTKLPKSCPSCRSPYWQKPLNKYWIARRKEYAAAKQARQPKDVSTPPDTGLQELAARQKKFNPPIIYPDSLRVYHAYDSAILRPVKPVCNFWLPEQLTTKPSNEVLYQPGNTIATTKPGVLNYLRYLIQNGLDCNKVLWITIVKTQPWQNYTQMVTTLKPDGSDNDRWFYNWPSSTPGSLE